ncbi:hypothetical protein DNTS_032495 [Danionella cerebrum]|uniref:Uncharacterized protein n=1 Tax=Danionella cerebrum TaxID=2873325 RepID=A0A553REG9_9TELE|nr:hypothetical protein DNTS_032495 [Danionella translucida]
MRSHVSSKLRHWIPPPLLLLLRMRTQKSAQSSSQQPEHRSPWKRDAPAGTSRGGMRDYCEPFKVVRSCLNYSALLSGSPYQLW